MNVVPFDFQGFSVRVIERDGEPWFVARDVARVLGYTDLNKALRMCKAGVRVRLVAGLAGNPNVTIIPEADVYRLIMRSKLPAATAFEELVCGTILPSIRKTGGYGNPPPPPAPVLDLNNAASLRQALLGYTEKVIELGAQVQEAVPKVRSGSNLASSINDRPKASVLTLEHDRLEKGFNWRQCAM